MKKQEVMQKVSSVISFIKERVETDIKEASAKELINVDKDQIDKICALAKQSIEASFFKSADQISKSLK